MPTAEPLILKGVRREPSPQPNRFEKPFKLEKIRDVFDKPYQIETFTRDTLAKKALYNHYVALKSLGTSHPAVFNGREDFKRFMIDFEKVLGGTERGTKTEEQWIQEAAYSYLDNESRQVLAIEVAGMQGEMLQKTGKVRWNEVQKGTISKQTIGYDAMIDGKNISADDMVTLDTNASQLPKEYVKAYFRQRTAWQGTELKNDADALANARVDFYRATGMTDQHKCLRIAIGREGLGTYLKPEFQGASFETRAKNALQIIGKSADEELREAEKGVTDKEKPMRSVKHRIAELEKPVSYTADELEQQEQDKLAKDKEIDKLEEDKIKYQRKQEIPRDKERLRMGKVAAKRKLDGYPKIHVEAEDREVEKLLGPDSDDKSILGMKKRLGELRKKKSNAEKRKNEGQAKIERKRKAIEIELAEVIPDGSDAAAVEKIHEWKDQRRTDYEGLADVEFTDPEQADIDLFNTLEGEVTTVEGLMTEEMKTTYTTFSTADANIARLDAEDARIGAVITAAEFTGIDDKIKLAKEQLAAIGTDVGRQKEKALYQRYLDDILLKKDEIASRIIDPNIRSLALPEDVPHAPGVSKLYLRAGQIGFDKEMVEVDGEDAYKKFNELMTEADFYVLAKDELKRIAQETSFVLGRQFSSRDELMRELMMHLDRKAMEAIFSGLERKTITMTLQTHEAQTVAHLQDQLEADLRAAGNIISY